MVVVPQCAKVPADWLPARPNALRCRSASRPRSLPAAAERRGQRADLPGLVALAAVDGARQRIEDDVLDALANRLRQSLVSQAGDEARELGGWRHSSFAPESLTALAHFTSSDLMS